MQFTFGNFRCSGVDTVLCSVNRLLIARRSKAADRYSDADYPEERRAGKKRSHAAVTPSNEESSAEEGLTSPPKPPSNRNRFRSGMILINIKKISLIIGLCI